MALRNVETAPAQEKMPRLVMEAAKRVPVEDYLFTRYRQDRFDLTEEEITQLLNGANAVGINIIDNEITPTKNAINKMARKVLEQIPLGKYLVIRKAIVLQELEENAREEIDFSSITGMGDWAAESAKRKEKWAAEYDLVERVVLLCGGD